MSTDDSLPDDVTTLKAMLLAERAARTAAEAASQAQALMIEKLKFAIAKMRHERFGQSSERGAMIEQLELQLADLEENAAEAEAAVEIASPPASSDTVKVQGFERRKPARRPLPDHLPRERIVYPSPAACLCCGGTLRKIGEDVTETLEVVPRQWKVIQHVREKFSCRSCEAITQPPAPSHPIARGRAGPGLLAHVLFSKYGLHLPLNRQSAAYAREGIDLDVSTLADWVGAATATLMPLIEVIHAHVFAAERIHADDTPVPVLAKGKTHTGRLWTYVRDDQPFAGPDPPAAAFFYSRDRGGEHPQRHLVRYAGLMQADAYAGFNRLYEAGRKPGPIVEAACWAHARRKFFDLARIKKAPIAIEAIKRIDVLFAIEREINGSHPSSALLRAPREVDRYWQILRPGCAANAGGSPQRMRLPRRSITASNAGRHSLGSSTTAGCASPTTPPSGRCAALPSGATTGPSQDQTKAADAPPPSTPSSRLPSSTTSTRKHGLPMSWRVCPIIPPSGSPTCCPGIGS